MTVTASTTPSYSIFEKKQEGGNMKEQSWLRFAGIAFCLGFALVFGYAPAASAQDGIEPSKDCNPQIL